MQPTNPGAPAVSAPAGLRLAAIIAVIVVVVIVVLGLVTRARGSTERAKWTAEQATPTVALVNPQPIGTSAGLQLPARLEAFASAPIYARASGYLKAWYVDIGSHVKAGQLMAEIETPDLDSQLAQAHADAASADANAALAAATAKRWLSMKGTDAVSQQEVDEKTGDDTTKQALAKAAHANLDRLAATQGFRRVLAPFDGVVTARGTDVGALINGSGSGGQALFSVADTHQLRAYVQVPQSQAAAIKQGQAVQLTVPEYPGRTYMATMDANSRSVNQASGAILVQLLVNNTDGSLLPGSYADVRFTASAGATGSVSLPASALIFDRNGLHVATLDAQNNVVMKPVIITRDLGKSVEIGAGLSSTDRVVDSPPDALSAGDAVRIAAVAPAAATPAVATPAATPAAKAGA